MSAFTRLGPLGLIALLTAWLCLAHAWPARACSSQAVLLDSAQELYNRRADLDQARQAAHRFRLALAAAPRCRQAALGLVKSLVWIGVLSAGDQEMDAFREAVETARELVRHDPRDGAAQYWLGTSQALKANAAGLSALALVSQARHSLQRALELDPGLDQGGPHRVLGRLYCKLPALLGGDYAKSERHLRQALELGPAYWLNHLYLAALLLELNRRDEARALLGQVLAGPAPAGQEPEYQLWRGQALRLLQRLDQP